MLITLNKRIRLEARKRKYGHDMTDEVTAEKTVWAYVGLPNMTFKSNAQSAGFAVDLIVHLRRAEFETLPDWTHVVVDGTSYKITSIGTSINDLFVKLAIARG